MSIERELLGRWHNGDLLPEEYMKLMKETKELLAQPEQELSVKLPESEDEAVLMNLLSDNWLRSHAPHRINQPEQGNIQYLLDQVSRLTAENAMLKEKWSAPKLKPLTPQQISEGNQSMFNVTREAFIKGVNFAEKAHGIGGGE